MIIAGLWAAVELNRNLANFISNTSDADAYFRAEQARYSLALYPGPFENLNGPRYKARYS